VQFSCVLGNSVTDNLCLSVPDYVIGKNKISDIYEKVAAKAEQSK